MRVRSSSWVHWEDIGGDFSKASKHSGQAVQEIFSECWFSFLLFLNLPFPLNFFFMQTVS